MIDGPVSHDQVHDVGAHCSAQVASDEVHVS
jgi:hypothetical protein